MAREGDACWVSAGEVVSVAGRTVEGGMIYVGGKLTSAAGGDADPSLLNPKLQVASGQVNPASVEFPYWGSYSRMDPRARAVVLDWLAAGRRDPDAPIGCVFVFFYGLERRILVDALLSETARAELPDLLAEVRALNRVYGHHDSFGGYASSLLEYVSFREYGAGEHDDIEPPTDRTGWAIPFRVKAVIGKIVASGEPIPPRWALAWLLTHPEIQLRTPGERCPSEFRELFLIRYQDTYGEGLRLKPNKTRLKAEYQAASGGIRRTHTIDTGLPDVTRLASPKNRLIKLAESVQDELDRYSRWVGRNGDRDSLAALALLPRDLLRGRDEGGLDAFTSWLQKIVGDEGSVSIEAQDLVGQWPSSEAGKLRKQEAEAMADMMAAFGYGLEPDVRFGGVNPSKVDRVVVFRGDAELFIPDAAYTGASALLHLGAAVAAADEEVTEDEERFLEAHLEKGLGIKGAQRIRLRAHLEWLLSSPPNLGSLRKKLGILPANHRQQVARFLLSLAGADGHISPAELKVLAKIYPLLGLDPSAISVDVHELAVGRDLGPVTVIPADPGSRDFVIPAPPREPQDLSEGVALDLDRIARIRGETAEVAAVLDGIFADEEADVDQVELDSGEGKDQQQEVEALPGLDPAHSALVSALMHQQAWSRVEFSRLAEQFGLMPGGAIETINEAAYSAFDEPLLEGEDPIELNPYTLEEMAA
jgi:uncharacterized tellurite resistance protein B-like protein